MGSPGSRQQDQVTAVFLVVTVVLAAVVAAVALFGRGPIISRSYLVWFDTGMSYEVETNGIYVHLGDRYGVERVVWDAFTLFLVVPAMLALAPGLARGVPWARVLAVGGLLLLLFQHYSYWCSWSGSIGLVATLVLLSSLVGVVLSADRIDLDELADHSGSRSATAASAPGVLFLVSVWILLANTVWARINDSVTARLGASWPTASVIEAEESLVLGSAHLRVFAPIALVTVVLLRRRSRLGDLLVATLLMPVAVLSTINATMVIAAGVAGHGFEPGKLAVFLVVGGASVVFLRRRYYHLPHRPESRTAARGPTPV
jgi:hypothetical protein